MYKARIKIHFFYVLVDLLLISFSFYLSYLVRSKLQISSITVKSFEYYFLIFALWGITLIFILNNFNLYSTDRSLTIPQEMLKVFRAVLYSAVLFAVIIFGLRIAYFSRFIFFAAALFLFVNLSGWRVAKRILVRYRIEQGFNNINVLIVGAGKSGKELAEEIEDSRYLGIKIAGFLDDYAEGNINGYKILGKIQDLKSIIQTKFIDEIYITIPSERKVVSKILLIARLLGKTVRILADNFEVPMYNVKINYIGFLPLVSYHEKSIHGADGLIKRLLDVIFASACLIVLFPFLLILAFLIKLDSPGPIFYVSKRSGKKGKNFNFYKLRSMYNDADKQKEALRHKSEVKGPIFKIKDDPRITSLGRILRRYSLDELAQLINVLKGEMSLVGPRPFPVEESNQCAEWQMRRLEVKPGMTCMAQVRGRSDLSFYKWMKWDLWYIDNWALGLDFRILFWTIPAILKRRGAY